MFQQNRHSGLQSNFMFFRNRNSGPLYKKSILFYLSIYFFIFSKNRNPGQLTLWKGFFVISENRNSHPFSKKTQFFMFSKKNNFYQLYKKIQFISYSLKVEIFAHFMLQKKKQKFQYTFSSYFDVLSGQNVKNVLYLPKTDISKTFLYLPKPEISK